MHRKDTSRFILVDGFNELAFHYMLPVIVGYCRQKSIPEIIVYKTDIKFLARILESFPLDQEDLPVIRNYRPFDSLRFIFKNPGEYIVFFAYILRISRLCVAAKSEALLRPTYTAADEFVVGVFHGFWDLLVKRFGEKTIEFSFRDRLRVLNRILRSLLVCLAVRPGSCDSLWLGHNVYQTRCLSEAAKLFNKPYFLHAYFVITRMSNYQQVPPPLPTQRTIARLDEQVSKEAVAEYFSCRFTDQSENRDVSSLVSSSPSSKFSAIPANAIVVFLPVLGDSPFGWPDSDRMFAHYFDWLKGLFDVLASVDDPVIFRYHPSSKLWGENSKSILAKLECDTIVKNLSMDDGSVYEHRELIRNAKHLLTFRGTVHIERVCFGFKPIVFTKVLLSEYLPEAVFMPKTSAELSQILSMPKAPVSESCRRKAMRLLTYKENHMGFRHRLEGRPMLRNDPAEYKQQVESEIRRRSKKEVEFFLDLGKQFASDPQFEQSIEF